MANLLTTLTPSALKAWRNRMGWSRTEAATHLHLKEDTYKKLENGQRPITDRVAAESAQLEKLYHSSGVALTQTTKPAIHVVGGGTISHVRTHLALAAPTYGSTARELAGICDRLGHRTRLTLTRMADPSSPYETPEDLQALANSIVAEPATKIVFWNPAICDYTGIIGGVASGRKAQRLKTDDGDVVMRLTPADKIVSSLRKTRKDLFLVAFKTTTNATPDDMYKAGLRLMKGAHINLVLVNDVVTRFNMIVAPEEALYHETYERVEALEGLVDMALLRSQCHFTSSKVVADAGVPWTSPIISDSLRTVVDHCIARGAYRPVQTRTHGAVTAGHFAIRAPNGRIITTRRWSNFNHLREVGMVEMETVGEHAVIAYGGKPSVGGQSQRIIFSEHRGIDNIVHFHCPVRPESRKLIPHRSQREVECGSHECGQNTSRGLKEVEPGIWAVMLENHGPNICYANAVEPARVVAFIEKHFDLDHKTGGSVD